MSNLSGKRLGQYEIGGVLGRGGMATVYRAHQSSMDRDVAVKVIMGGLADNPDFIARFERESRLIARLQHPHILPVYDFGREEGLLYLVMRLVEGGSLDDRLKRGAIPLPQAARMFTQIASAMSYAHRNGVIHRDMKPNNILLDEQENCYLMDFGIAKMMEGGMGSNLTATGVVMGTPAYMSPEQWRSDPVDSRTDIYALGVMLYEMLTGQRPFSSDTPFGMMHKHLDEVATPPSRLNPSIPDSVNAVISKALAKNIDDRYHSADSMAQDLNAALTGTAIGTAVATQPPASTPDNVGTLPPRVPTVPIPTSIPPPPPPPVPLPTTTQGSRLPLIAAGVITVIMIAAIGGGLVITSQQSANNATGTQAANVGAANTRIAQVATGTAFALLPTSTLTPTVTRTPTVTNTTLPASPTVLPTITPLPPTATLIPPTATLPAKPSVASVSSTVPPTSAPASVTPLPTAVRFTDFQSKSTNIRFRYPDGWGIDNTKFADYIIFLTPHFDDLKFADNGTVTGAPYIQIYIGDAEGLGVLDMAQAKTAAEAMTTYFGEKLQNLDDVPGTRFPTVTTQRPNAELGVIKVNYLSMLGPDRFIVILLQTPPELSKEWTDRYALPLVRSLNYVATPTQVVAQVETATPAAEVTFVPPEKFKTLTFVALQARMSVPDNWNVRLNRSNLKPFVFMAPPESSVTIKDADNFASPVNTLADEPFIVVQKQTKTELRSYAAGVSIIDQFKNTLGEYATGVTDVSNAPFLTAYGRTTGQSRFMPINGWLALIALDKENFLLITASAPRGHEDEYWESVVLPMINSLKYSLGGTATPGS